MNRFLAPAWWMAVGASAALLLSSIVNSPTVVRQETEPAGGVKSVSNTNHVPNAKPTMQVDLPTTWIKATGVQEAFDDRGNLTLSRNVTVWAASDGRYRVKTTSRDDSGASEEVAHDGQGHQLVLFTRPSGSQSAVRVDGNSHFAIDGLGADELRRSMGVVTSSSFTGDKGSISYYVVGAPEQIDGDASTLEIVIPEGVSIRDSSNRSSSSTALYYISSGSASETMYDLTSSAPCLYAYNYRNSTSNFFTTNSQVRSSCNWVDVSAWDYHFVGVHCGGAWQGSGPTSAYYSAWTGYFQAANSAAEVCSQHAGWDSSWILQVPWRALRASVVG